MMVKKITKEILIKKEVDTNESEVSEEINVAIVKNYKSNTGGTRDSFNIEKDA